MVPNTKLAKVRLPKLTDTLPISLKTRSLFVMLNCNAYVSKVQELCLRAYASLTVGEPIGSIKRCQSAAYGLREIKPVEKKHRLM